MDSTMAKTMEKKLYAMVNCLADNYGFDADAAFEHVRWETDVDHVGEILKMIGAEEKKDDNTVTESTTSGGDIAEKIATCKKNIALWEKKLADGKSKDADKQREKITKEKAKLAKLEAKAPKEEPKKPEPKKEEPKKEDAKKEKEKRIKRFSPVMASQLKTALEGVGLEMNDKLKKEFQQYIEDLTDDDYRAAGLADHMRAFAKLKAPATPKKEEPEEEDEEIAPVKKEETPSNAAGGGPKVVDVSLQELRNIKMTAEIDTPGTYWDADVGRFVKGPESDDDEDVVEVKFDNKDYVVGEKTGRVYEVRETGDIFAGFAGVGKFKAMKVD